MASISGGCACGRVRYIVTAEPVAAAFCQCRACRWDTGAGHAASVGFPVEAVTIVGELRYWESLADSGARAARSFCPVCGAPISFTSTGMPDLAFVTAGSLDDPEVFEPEMVVFTAGAPSWDRIDPALPRFPGMPES
ncbi:MAG TPA: GFA family protein [Rhodospirillales bacterium]|nr:GFA family protein [Rhodospirillales bacterium]